MTVTGGVIRVASRVPGPIEHRSPMIEVGSHAAVAALGSGGAGLVGARGGRAFATRAFEWKRLRWELTESGLTISDRSAWIRPFRESNQ